MDEGTAREADDTENKVMGLARVIRSTDHEVTCPALSAEELCTVNELFRDAPAREKMIRALLMRNIFPIMEERIPVKGKV